MKGVSASGCGSKVTVECYTEEGGQSLLVYSVLIVIRMLVDSTVIETVL